MAGARDFAAHLGVTTKDLLDAAKDLRLQLAKYPTRIAVQR